MEKQIELLSVHEMNTIFAGGLARDLGVWAHKTWNTFRHGAHRYMQNAVDFICSSDPRNLSD